MLKLQYLTTIFLKKNFLHIFFHRAGLLSKKLALGAGFLNEKFHGRGLAGGGEGGRSN